MLENENFQTEPAAPAAPHPDAQPAKAAFWGALSWARDLAFSILIAVILIVFIYQPVKVEGTSMMPTLTDQEGFLLTSSRITTVSAKSSAGTWWCSGIRWTTPSRTLSGSSDFRATRSGLTKAMSTSTASC